MHATAGGVHQHGGRTINHVTCSNLLVARLQEILFRDRSTDWGYAAVNRENRTDRDVNIDVG
ncbi:hypothetical protein SDC9_201995 [bioreactor metagenome]|uniref:Uncharacterized protein n=1 Tax=bioreactor metagenome TaxID=1076179 RepID=A0A645ISF3_9ZZZZ